MGYICIVLLTSTTIHIPIGLHLYCIADLYNNTHPDWTTSVLYCRPSTTIHIQIGLHLYCIADLYNNTHPDWATSVLYCRPLQQYTSRLGSICIVLQTSTTIHIQIGLHLYCIADLYNNTHPDWATSVLYCRPLQQYTSRLGSICIVLLTSTTIHIQIGLHLYCIADLYNNTHPDWAPSVLYCRPLQQYTSRLGYICIVLQTSTTIHIQIGLHLYCIADLYNNTHPDWATSVLYCRPLQQYTSRLGSICIVLQTSTTIHIPIGLHLYCIADLYNNTHPDWAPSVLYCRPLQQYTSRLGSICIDDRRRASTKNL